MFIKSTYGASFCRSMDASLAASIGPGVFVFSLTRHRQVKNASLAESIKYQGE